MLNASRNVGLINLEFTAIGKALSDNTLKVPRFQRNYAWEDENVEALFTDIGKAINDKEEVYFLGSIVTVQTDDGRLLVIDGQQRLVTISILFAAIRDYFHEKKDNRQSIVEDRFLTTVNIQTMDKEQRLVLNDSDNEFFNKAILSETGTPERNVEAIKKSHIKISRAAEIAAERVQEIVKETNDPFARLVDWITYLSSKIKVIWFTASSEANAFMIFETLNDRGLDLTIADLIKNHLFSHAQNKLRDVEDGWLTIITTFEAADREDVIVEYIHNYWSSINGLTRERELYSKITSQITSPNEVLELTTNLAQSAKLYIAMYSPDHEFWEKFDLIYATYKVRDGIRTLNVLKIERFRTLLLAILRKFEDKEIARAIQSLVSWTVRLLIDGGGGGTVEKKYPELAAKVSTGTITTTSQLFTEMETIIPNDKQFQTAFATITISRANIARYLLNAIEEHVRGGNDPELVPNGNPLAVNLEHVLPDKKSDNWKHISDEEHKAYRNRLGNLTMMGSRRNSTIKDAPFQDKKKEFASSDLRITQMIAEETNWTRDEIEKRQTYLAGLATKVWKYRPVQ